MSNDTKVLLAKYKRSGLTQKEFCDKNAIGLSTLRYHLYKSNHVADTQKSAVPSFISVPASKPTPQPCTIIMIRGNYSPSQLAVFLNETYV